MLDRQAELVPVCLSEVLTGDRIRAKCEISTNSVILELQHIAAPSSGQPYWITSRRALIELLLECQSNGQEVMMTPHTSNSRGMEGRFVTKLYCVGSNHNRGAWVDVQLEMLNRGHVWHKAGTSTDSTQALYAAAQQQAKERRLGLWSTDSAAPMEPWVWQRESLMTLRQMAQATDRIGADQAGEYLRQAEQRRYDDSEYLEDDLEYSERRARKGLGCGMCFY